MRIDADLRPLGLGPGEVENQAVDGEARVFTPRMYDPDHREQVNPADNL